MIFVIAHLGYDVKESDEYTALTLWKQVFRSWISQTIFIFAILNCHTSGVWNVLLPKGPQRYLSLLDKELIEFVERKFSDDFLFSRSGG